MWLSAKRPTQIADNPMVAGSKPAILLPFLLCQMLWQSLLALLKYGKKNRRCEEPLCHGKEVFHTQNLLQLARNSNRDFGCSETMV